MVNEGVRYGIPILIFKKRLRPAPALAVIDVVCLSMLNVLIVLNTLLCLVKGRNLDWIIALSFSAFVARHTLHYIHYCGKGIIVANIIRYRR